MNKDKLEGARIVAAATCHHVNNIMSIIVGNAEMIALTDSDEKRAKFKEDMSKGINRLRDVMARFKTVSMGQLDDLPMEEGTNILDINSIEGTVEGG